MTIITLQKEKILEYEFLRKMYKDSYFPIPLVDKLRNLMLDFCVEVEEMENKSLEQYYKLGEELTEEINMLQEEFFRNDCEIESVAKKAIFEDFEYISRIYDYREVDIEILFANREW
ncbi:DUF5713 family protein [Aureivirga sp. CE67]|uniref:DUF5713 family protein n=1 Tax=Aureivirga sp. CE67 TaxID=1788983 RepID=UPI0018CA67FB|nr:DUF5713 family protein [Aureivirga sp. CE67]